MTIPAIFWALAGLALGSFLNVCITRLPRHESVVRPRSHCRDCGRQVLPRDNVPLVSWLMLHGRCRNCGATISWRYPLVELTTCLLFLACWFRFGTAWQSAAWSILCFLLLGLAVMDAETMLLPDRFTLPGLALGIFAAAIRGASSVTILPGESAPLAMHLGLAIRHGLAAAGFSALDAAAAALSLAALAAIYRLLRNRTGLGLGDVKLLALLAAWLGLPQTLLAFGIGVIAGAAYGLYLLTRNAPGGRRIAGSLAVPFGTFLSMGGLYSLFLGERTLRWYMQLFR